MKNSFLQLIAMLVLLLGPHFSHTLSAQDIDPAASLFVGGGALAEEMYVEFLKVAGADAKLVVVPTASSREVDVAKIQERWRIRGFHNISVLHTRDRETASSADFIAPLESATAVWFNGGSQQRIADAYLGTLTEEAFYQVIKRGGIIGGSSAGAAIMSEVMIVGGKEVPKIATGMTLFDGVILDQHFLKRNRLARLIEAVKQNPDLTGFGIDEGTAIVVYGTKYKIVGNSYVMRIQMKEGEIKIDAFEDGDEINIIE